MEVQQLLPVLLVQPLCSNNFHWFLWWHLTHEIISLMYFSISIVPFTMRRTPYITLERSNHLRDLWDKLRIPLLQLRILMAIWCLWHLQHLWSRCDTCGQNATLTTLEMMTLATLSKWVILRFNTGIVTINRLLVYEYLIHSYQSSGKLGVVNSWIIKSFYDNNSLMSMARNNRREQL
jgi:hypothetical protein